MKSIYKLLLATAPVLLIAACGGGEDSLDDRLDIADPKVRLVHAAAATSSITLYRNDLAQADATGVSYAGASRYFDVANGSASWRVATSGANVGTLNFNATQGDKFTVVAVPDVALTGAELLLISDPYDRDLTSNRAHVRVLHAASNTPAAVDVYFNADTADITNVGPNFTNVGYKSVSPASGSNSTGFTAGGRTYNLVITAQGSKTALFRAQVPLGNNADWLVNILPGSLVPGDLRVVVVRGEETPVTQEIPNAP